MNNEGEKSFKFPEISGCEFTDKRVEGVFSFLYELNVREDNKTALEVLKPFLSDDNRDKVLKYWGDIKAEVGAILTDEETIYRVHTEPFERINIDYSNIVK